MECALKYISPKENTAKSGGPSVPPSRLPTGGPRNEARPAARPKTLADVVKAPAADTNATRTRDAILACLHHAATTFVEGRPDVDGMDAIALRQAVATRLGLNRSAATSSEFKAATAYALTVLKKDGHIRRTTGGWWALTAKESKAS